MCFHVSKAFENSMAITTVRVGFFLLNPSTTFWVRGIKAEVVGLFLRNKDGFL